MEAATAGEWERGWSGFASSSSASSPSTRKRNSAPGPAAPAPAPSPRSGTFAALGMGEAAARALQAEGLGRPTRIQSMCFEKILRGDSVAVLAETGSGKTYAYALPLMVRFERARRHLTRGGSSCRVSPALLVLVPTEELAEQAGAMLSKAAAWVSPLGNREVLVSVLTGKSKKLLRPRGGAGKATEEDERARRALEGSQVVVATPSRANRLAEEGYIVPHRLQAVVIDEADEMLSEGFREPVCALVRGLLEGARGSEKRRRGRHGDEVQVILAAATMPAALMQEIEGLLRAPALATVASGRLHRKKPNLRHDVVRVASEEERREALRAAVDRRLAKGEQVLVFTDSTEECDDVAAFLSSFCGDGGVRRLHGRGQRGRGALDAFALGGAAVLVATDHVAARGIDFPMLRHVVEYRPARSLRLMLHRIGRTARSGQVGPFTATTIVSGEGDELARAERFMDRSV